jgi:hypothetical protein
MDGHSMLPLVSEAAVATQGEGPRPGSVKNTAITSPSSHLRQAQANPYISKEDFIATHTRTHDAKSTKYLHNIIVAVEGATFLV